MWKAFVSDDVIMTCRQNTDTNVRCRLPVIIENQKCLLKTQIEYNYHMLR